MKTYKCLHKAQYYETDQMGIIHHSNYIRWFEEARVNFMEELGFPYSRMEKELKLSSPVLEAECRYKSMVHFGDLVELCAGVEILNGIRLKFHYEVKDAKSGELRATGFTSHCFLNENGSFVSLKKDFPELYALLKECSEK